MSADAWWVLLVTGLVIGTGAAIELLRRAGRKK